MLYPLLLLEIDCKWPESKLNSQLQRLPASVKKRAQRYLSKEARRNLIVTQSRLAEVLGLLGIELSRVLIADNGRPYDGDNQLQFNLTHSRDKAFLAFSLDPNLQCGLGVDTEWTGRPSDFQTLGKRFFTTDEQAWIGNHRQRFYQIWTRKEAVLKSSGTGLRVALNSFCVLEDLLDDKISGHRLILQSKTTIDGYLLSWSLTSEPSKTIFIKDSDRAWKRAIIESLQPKGKDSSSR